MLFPGMKKLGRELGFQRNNNKVFGMYRDCHVVGFDGNNLKVLILATGEVPPEIRKEIAAISGYRKFRLMETSDPELILNFIEYFRPYPVAHIRAILDEVIDILERHSFEGIRSGCDNCERSDFEYHSLNDIPVALCANCLAQVKDELEDARREYDTAPTNYVKGFFLGTLTALPVMAVQVLLFVFLGRIAVLSSALYVLVLSKSMKWYRIKASAAAAGILTMLSLALTILGAALSYFLLILRETGDIARTLKMLRIAEVRSEMYTNIILQVVVSAIYLIFIFFNIRKQWTFSGLEYPRRIP